MLSGFEDLEKIEVLDCEVLKKENRVLDGKNGDSFWIRVSKGVAWLPKGKARSAMS